MQREKSVEKVEFDIHRTESLGLPMFTESDDVTLEFRSPDDDDLFVYIIDAEEKHIEFVGGFNMTNFLAFCRRALELWEKEA